MLAVKHTSASDTSSSALAFKNKDRIHNANYAGEVTAEESWDALSSSPNALLVDVRTPPEWTFAGIPDISSLGKEVVALSWKIYPTYVTNEQFVDSLKKMVPSLDTPLFFICRTGGRSLDAAIAATEAGYKYAFNVTDGFEGPMDESQHRGSVRGWKAANLPWVQG